MIYELIYIELNQSDNSLILKGSEKTLGINLTSVINEPPFKENDDNISYIGEQFSYSRWITFNLLTGLIYIHIYLF